MKQFFFYISFLVFSFAVFSQDKIANVKIDSTNIEFKKFDKEQIESYKNQDDFNYNVIKKEKNFIERFWEWLSRVTKKFLSLIFDDIGPAVGVLGFIVKMIPWLVLAILFYFITKYFLRINSRKSAEKINTIPKIHLTDDADLIKNKDLNSLINSAIKNKDYRLAVRFYYLLVLQKLAEKELIVWQQEKTNEDFIREVANHKIANDFIESTRLYDFIWYGNFDVNEASFSKAEILFKKLTNSNLG